MKLVWKGMILLVFALFGLPLLAIFAASWSHLRDFHALKDHGVEVTGQVERLYSTSRRHGGSDGHVVYRYSRSTKSGVGSSTTSVDGFASPAIYRSLSEGQPAPVRYDPRNPDRVMLSAELYSQSVEENPFRTQPALLLLVIIPAGIIAVTYGLYLKEKRLLSRGISAAAQIIGEHETQKRGVRYSTVRYSFADAKGGTVQGSGGSVPTEDDSRPRFNSYRDSLLKNPTVLYDPNDSSKNMLYPGAFARLV